MGPLFRSEGESKDKSKKLKRLGTYLYVAADIGLMAYVQNDYKFMMFGKTTRACVYRIADLRSYKYEEQLVKNGDKSEKKPFARLSFTNTQGLYEFVLPMNNRKDFEALKNTSIRCSAYRIHSATPRTFGSSR